mmetsp:Transcript_8161/g.36404  ORF Transcript_8161/g.36404 Transcript_8161/m.36404 type:complete len:165 (-) Transcript_8161:2576-3070(-)
MPEAARSNVLGCVCFISCFYESADGGAKRDMKSPFLVQLLDALRCCFTSEESLRKGLTKDLVHLMTCIPLSVLYLPNFLRAYLTAIERCIIWSPEDAGEFIRNISQVGKPDWFEESLNAVSSRYVCCSHRCCAEGIRCVWNEHVRSAQEDREFNRGGQSVSSRY